LQAIAGEGRGLVIYEHQEGRGIGLMAKLQAYELQDMGLDTVDANLRWGSTADYRDFNLPAAILHELGIRRVRLLSNNRASFFALFQCRDRSRCARSLRSAANPHSIRYLRPRGKRWGTC